MSTFLDIQLDPALLARARQGEHAAREQLYTLLARPVYTLIRRLVVRPAVAEELLHDTFIELFRKLEGYRADGSFAGWVRSIAVSQALMHLRSPWHRRLLPGSADPDSAADPGSAVDAQGDGSALERALNLLPPISRSIVWLHDVEGYTHGEIARQFGRTTSFSKSQLARAHEQLRALLDPQPDGLACTPLSRT